MRQLVYLSTAYVELDATELDRILVSARAFNTATGVTGMLAYGEGVFFQVLEGAGEAIDAVLARLHLDPRHFGITILDDRQIEARDFADWAMAYTPLTGPASIIARQGEISPRTIPDIVARLDSPLIAVFLKRFDPDVLAQRVSSH